MKAQDWDSAIDVLHGGALALLKAGQGGSGGDLSRALVDVLSKSEKSLDSNIKGDLLPPKSPLLLSGFSLIRCEPAKGDS